MFTNTSGPRLPRVIPWSSALRLTPLIVLALGSRPAVADQVVLISTRDTTLYESPQGLVGNGSGARFFAGRTNGNGIRRGLVFFDLASAVPAGSTVTSVTLRLRMSKTSAGPKPIRLHRALASWGEGASNAAGEEGGGEAAAFSDATWVHRFYWLQTWMAAGGDHNPTASATTTVGGIAFYTWSSATMVQDVQAWVGNPDGNHGWMVRGDEAVDQTTKRFDTREHAGTEPLLTVNFTPPAGAGACCLTSGTCMLSSGTACTNAGGAFQGPGSACAPSTCSQPGGACCFEDQTCAASNPADCAAGSGVYQGDGAGCTPDLCVLPTGTCCFANGSCTDLSASACQAQIGNFGGTGTSCAANPCPSGACCFDATTCFFLSANACVQLGGMYEGNGTACTPGACAEGCLDAASCADLDDDGVRDDGCMWWSCAAGECQSAPVGFADLGGAFGACFPDGVTDGHDRFHALNCFANSNTAGGPGYSCEASPPQAFNVDAGGPFGDCQPDGVCDGNDAFHALNAFEGLSSCTCAPGPAPLKRPERAKP